MRDVLQLGCLPALAELNSHALELFVQTRELRTQALLRDMEVARAQAFEEFCLVRRICVAKVRGDSSAKVKRAALAAAKEKFGFGFHRFSPQGCVAPCVATGVLSVIQCDEAL